MPTPTDMAPGVRDVASVPRSRLRQSVTPLGDLGARWYLVPLAPVGLTVLVVTAAYTATGGTDPGFPTGFPVLLYGLANVVVVVGVWIRVDDRVRGALAPVSPPGAGELAASVLATVLGVLACWPLTTVITDLLGVARYAVPALPSSFAVAAVLFGSVVVAPVTEEVLYRGLLFGLLVERGVAVVLAATISVIVFAAMHVFTAGVAGVVNALLLGALLTWLRVWFDSLVGAWLLHGLNNLLEFLVALSVLPSLYGL